MSSSSCAATLFAEVTFQQLHSHFVHDRPPSSLNWILVDVDPLPEVLTAFRILRFESRIWLRSVWLHLQGWSVQQWFGPEVGFSRGFAFHTECWINTVDVVSGAGGWRWIEHWALSREASPLEFSARIFCCSDGLRRIQMDLDWFRWIQMGSDGFRWIQMDSDWFRWIQIGSDGFRWVQMDSDVFRWIQMGSDEFRLVQMDSDGFRLVQMSSYGFRWVQMDSDGFRWIKVDSDGFRQIEHQRGERFSARILFPLGHLGCVRSTLKVYCYDYCDCSDYCYYVQMLSFLLLHSIACMHSIVCCPNSSEMRSCVSIWAIYQEHSWVAKPWCSMSAWSPGGRCCPSRAWWSPPRWGRRSRTLPCTRLSSSASPHHPCECAQCALHMGLLEIISIIS